jgi:hypothetical protein
MAGRQQTAPPQQRRSKDATTHPDDDDDDAFYLFLQKQKRAYGHIPILWVLPHTEKKRGTCDDASTITLVVQWWFFVPFGTRGRVL